MPEPWLSRALLVLAFACTFWGFAAIATAMDAHWRQVTGGDDNAGRRVVLVLRVLGAVALAASLLLCFLVDHATMAPLVWVMSLAGAALIVAMVLAWRPHWLAPLVPFAARARRSD